MSFFRFGLERPDLEYHRSLMPIPFDPQKTPFFSYRYYTSEKDDSPTWNVISIGHERRWSQKDVKGRTTRKFAIHYCIRGSGTCNGQRVTPGCFFVTFPFQHFAIETNESDAIELYYITIQGNDAENLLRDAIPNLATTVYACPFIEHLPQIFDDALSQPHTECDADLFMYSIAFRLLSMHKQVAAGPDHSALNKKSFEYYKFALQYVSQYLTDRLTPTDVASFLHISPSYLRRIFSQHCRYSLREFLIRSRIDYAASLLTNEDTPITEISQKIGYPDYTFFSTIFKKYMGVSPREYRMQKINKRLIEPSVDLV